MLINITVIMNNTTFDRLGQMGKYTSQDLENIAYKVLDEIADNEASTEEGEEPTWNMEEIIKEQFQLYI